MVNLTIGRMIWLKQVVDPQGNLKGPHAAVVLTSKEELDQGKPIRAVVISSQLRNLSEDQMVRLRHLSGPKGHPQTGLNRPSAAIGHWIVDVPNEDIERTGNLIFGSTLESIIQCVNRVKAAAKKTETSEPPSTHS